MHGIAALPVPGEVPLRVWTLDLAVPGDESIALLTTADRDRLGRMDDPHRRRLVARRTALARVVAAHLGVEPRALRLVDDAGRLVVGTDGGDPVPLSTSHSADVGLVTIGTGTGTGGVGVDVEVVAPVPEAASIAADLFHPDEARWIGTGAGQLARFLAVWVRKEAVVKVTGEGLSRDLRSFAVAPGAGVEPVHGDARIVTHGLGLPGVAAAVAWLT